MAQTEAKPKFNGRSMAMMEDRLLSVREVAARLVVSTRQVWKLRSSGKLPAPVRLARSVRWRESDIALFIECGCDMRAFDAARKAVRP